MQKFRIIRITRACKGSTALSWLPEEIRDARLGGAKYRRGETRRFTGWVGLTGLGAAGLMNDPAYSDPGNSNSRPASGCVSSIPASRKQCHAIAWLLEVMGTPVRFSTRATASATRKLVQDTNTASTPGVDASFSAADSIDADVMRAASRSSSRSKVATAAMSTPRPLKYLTRFALI